MKFSNGRGLYIPPPIVGLGRTSSARLQFVHVLWQILLEQTSTVDDGWEESVFVGTGSSLRPKEPAACPGRSQIPRS